MQQFIDNLRSVIPQTEISKKNNLSYLAAATAVARAERPLFKYAEFEGIDGQLLPFQAMLGGGVVAVQLMLDEKTHQTMYLPIMDRDNLAIPLKQITVTDINNSRQRCLVKAVAAVTGVGMSVFMGCDGDGEKAIKVLGLDSSADLATVTPIVSKTESGAPYIEWTYGLAAARIVDPSFKWSVKRYGAEKLPFREVQGSIMVDVMTTFKGRSLVISLPTMDGAFNPIPADKVDVLNWNKTVMRALTKCIAFNTGYGLNVYADETGVKAETVARASTRGGSKKDSAKAAATTAAPAPASSATPAPAPAAKASTDTPDSASAETGKVAEASAAEATPPAAQATTETAEQSTKVNADVSAAAPAPQAEAQQASTDATVAQAPVAKVDEPASADGGEVKTAAPAPVAEATPEPTAGPESDVIAARNAEVERFKGVMAGRRDSNGVEGVITLFQALTASNKFKEEDKPDCFIALIQGLATLVKPEHVTSMLEHMHTFDAAKYLPPELRRMIGQRLTDRSFEAAMPKGDEAVNEAAQLLVRSGIADDLAHVFELSQEGNLPQATKDYLAAALDDQPA